MLRPSARVTSKVVASPTTWALVTILPALSSTTPEPSPVVVEIWTTEGRTRSTTWMNASWSESARPIAGVVVDVCVAAGDGGVASWPEPLHPPSTAAVVKTTTSARPRRCGTPARASSAGRAMSSVLATLDVSAVGVRYDDDRAPRVADARG